MGCFTYIKEGFEPMEKKWEICLLPQCFELPAMNLSPGVQSCRSVRIFLPVLCGSSLVRAIL